MDLLYKLQTLLPMALQWAKEHSEKVQKEGKVFYELKLKDSEDENRLEVLFRAFSNFSKGVECEVF